MAASSSSCDFIANFKQLSYAFIAVIVNFEHNFVGNVTFQISSVIIRGRL